MNNRYYSLDVFRGATVALMILVNNPGSWSHIYGPLEHAPWHGCTPTDLVFPFFLFAVGNAMAFVMPRLEQAGNAVFLKKVFRRTALIFLIGLLLNMSPFVRWEGEALVLKTYEKLRIMGVLQRIALCYCFASLAVYYLKARGAFVLAGVLLLGYWGLCVALGQPGDSLSINGWFGNIWDKAILGEAHLYKGEGQPFDPEGLASTFAAMAQVIFGYLAGRFIQLQGKTYEMLSRLLITGLVCTVAAMTWDLVFPINKKIWTSSYTLYTSGLAMLTIGFIIYVIEFREKRGWLARFFDVFGKNPLFIFVLSGFLPRTFGLIRIPNGLNDEGQPAYLSPFGWFYKTVCAPVGSDPRTGSLLYALCMILFYWLIVYIMDRRRIYVKV